MTALEFKRVNDAIRIWNNMGFTVDAGVSNFTLYEKESDKEQDNFRDGNELYTAAVYYQLGYFHAKLDAK